MSVVKDFSCFYPFFREMKDEFISKLELSLKDIKTIAVYQVIVDSFLQFIYNKKLVENIEELYYRVIIAFIRAAEVKYHSISDKSFS